MSGTTAVQQKPQIVIPKFEITTRDYTATSMHDELHKAYQEANPIYEQGIGDVGQQTNLAKSTFDAVSKLKEPPQDFSKVKEKIKGYISVFERETKNREECRKLHDAYGEAISYLGPRIVEVEKDKSVITSQARIDEKQKTLKAYKKIKEEHEVLAAKRKSYRDSLPGFHSALYPLVERVNALEGFGSTRGWSDSIGKTATAMIYWSPSYSGYYPNLPILCDKRENQELTATNKTTEAKTQKETKESKKEKTDTGKTTETKIQKATKKTDESEESEEEIFTDEDLFGEKEKNLDQSYEFGGEEEGWSWNPISWITTSKKKDEIYN